jgi:hypothetical protein
MNLTVQISQVSTQVDLAGFPCMPKILSAKNLHSYKLPACSGGENQNHMASYYHTCLTHEHILQSNHALICTQCGVTFIALYNLVECYSQRGMSCSSSL